MFGSGDVIQEQGDRIDRLNEKLYEAILLIRRVAKHKISPQDAYRWLRENYKSMCPDCGQMRQSKNESCSGCGHELSSPFPPNYKKSKIICPECGSKDQTGIYCSVCGNELD